VTSRCASSANVASRRQSPSTSTTITANSDEQARALGGGRGRDSGGGRGDWRLRHCRAGHRQPGSVGDVRRDRHVVRPPRRRGPPSDCSDVLRARRADRRRQRRPRGWTSPGSSASPSECLTGRPARLR
jgi:hypothetical protein